MANYHVEIYLTGAKSDLDEHQKWVEETAALAEKEVTVKFALTHADELTDEFSTVARFSTHFDAEKPMDAMLMGMGLMGPREDSPLDIQQCAVLR